MKVEDEEDKREDGLVQGVTRVVDVMPGLEVKRVGCHPLDVCQA